MAVYRIDLAYDGSGFHGYAKNPGVRTIQGALEAALAQILGREVETIVAGRTDAGVHARGQVVSFSAEGIDTARLVRSLTSMLGPEVAVSGCTEVPDDFHARFSARSRTYRYRVSDAVVADPLRRTTVWHVGTPLDVEAMTRAAGGFVGEHDFASLCRAKPAKTTLRTVVRAGWTRTDDLVVYETEAVAFCHQMVRSMVALCVAVGQGRLDPDAIPGIIAARDRNAARGAAPPHGLVLERVNY